MNKQDRIKKIIRPMVIEMIKKNNILKESDNRQSEVKCKELITKLLNISMEFEDFNKSTSDEFWDTRGEVMEKWLIDALKKIYNAFSGGNRNEKEYSNQLFKK